MTPSFRLRTGIFPGKTPGPVEVLDVIVEGFVVGSFYRLATDLHAWEFLGPWDDQNGIPVDGAADSLMRDDRTFWLYTDGASREDGTKAAIGAVLYDSQGQEVRALSDFIGSATNNEAEYRAFIGGLEMALRQDTRCLVVRSDSLLVVNQVRGTFKVRSSQLRLLHGKALELLNRFPKYHLEHIPRKYNRRADRLANEAFSNPSE